MKTIRLITEIANMVFGGHFMIMKFTTNYKVCFGQEVERVLGDYPGFIHMAEGKTLEEATINALIIELKRVEK